MGKKSNKELAKEYFTHMVGKTIEGVAINNDQDLEILLHDDSIVVIWSDEDLSLTVEYPPLLN